MTRKLVLLILLAIASTSPPACKRGKMVSYNHSFELSSTERAALKRRVDLGDGAAAFRLFRHYEMWEEDYAQAGFYLKRSAQLGYPPGVETLAKWERDRLLKDYERKAAEDEGVRQSR
jgi:hypothetical protein